MAGKKKIAAFACGGCFLIILLLVIFVKKDSNKDVLNVRAADEVKSVSISKTDKVKMENGNFALRLNEDTLAIEIDDKKNGKTYRTSQDYTEGNDIWNAFCASGVTLEVYSGNSAVSEKVSVSSAEHESIVAYRENGFDADIHFTKYDISLQLQVSIDDDGLEVTVPGDSIKEGESYFVGGIWLYPMLGSTYLGETKGYMIIPEGTGATISLEDNNGKYKNAYVKRIFGKNVGVETSKNNTYGVPVVKDEQSIVMPVFGFVYEDEGCAVLGIVDEGKYNANIAAYPNGVITPYNWAGAEFVVRDIYTKQTARAAGVPIFEPKGDIRSVSMVYRFTGGKDADYSGLAKKYREYLLEKGLLSKNDTDYDLKLDVLCADSDKWIIFDSVVEMTDMSDVERILNDLKASGAENIAPVVCGFQKQGVSLACGSTDVKPSGKVGDIDTSYGLEAELLLANTSKLYNTTSDIVKGINQVLVTVPTYQKNFETMYYMTPKRTGEVLGAYIKEYEDAEERLSITGISNTLFSYYSGGRIYSRADYAAQLESIFEKYGVKHVGMSAPNEYMWKYMDAFYDMPLASSGYNYITEEIPFLPIVLKGYVPYWTEDLNFEANETESLLKVIEYGAYPSFLVTGKSPALLRLTNSSYIYTSEYEVLKEKIVRYEEIFRELAEKTKDATIASHRNEGGVAITTYTNGTVVIVNYSDSTADAEGVTVEPCSYIIAERK